MKKLKQFLWLISLMVIFMVNVGWGQVTGDFRSKGTGNWDAFGSWEKYNGTNWVDAISGETPTLSSSVYIQSAHTITLQQNESCLDLHIAKGRTASADAYLGKITIQTFTLSVNGKLRCYYAAVGTVPGTSYTVYASYPFTGTSGKVSIVGNSRNLTETGEWGATVTNPSTGIFPLEINLNNGQTVTMNTSIKATSWNVVTGTIDAGTNTISADNNITAQGDITIGINGTILSNASSSSNIVFQRTGTTKAGTLTVTGTLILSGQNPVIAMNAISFNGTVEYSRTGVQTLTILGNSGASPNTYTNLTLNGSEAKTLAYNTTINGKLTMAGTASLALSTFSLTYGASSTLKYNGSSAQTTADAEFPSSGSAPNLIIDNSSSVNLHSSRTVSGTLTMTNGNISTGANTLTIDGSISVTFHDNTKMIILDNGTNQGTLKLKMATNSTNYLFPIGDSRSGNRYSPITLNFSTGLNSSSYVSAKVFGIKHLNNSSSSPILNRYWDLIPTGLDASYSYNIVMQYLDGDVTGTEADLVFGKYSTSWIQLVGTLNQSLNTFTTTTPITTFSSFSGGQQSQLPVSIASFTSSVTGRNTNLKWVTASETNNVGFEILRSAQNDNGSWTKVGYVTGSGTKTTPTNYKFDDKKLNTGKYNYRLKQIDNNGNFEYYNLSSVVEVGVPTKYDISQNYPNPFNPTTKIDFDLPFDSKVSLKLYDMSGRELLTIVNEQKTAGYYTAQVNAGNLSSGAYFYRFTAGNFTATKKMLMIK